MRSVHLLAGMIFMHELKYAQGLKDPRQGFLVKMPHLRGETVDHMNRIRGELGLPLRDQYLTKTDTSGRYYIPFANGPIYVPARIGQ